MIEGSNYKRERCSLKEVLDYLNKVISVFETTGNEMKNTKERIGSEFLVVFRNI